MLLVDSHCHLDAAEFDHDRAAVIERARAAGVARQIVPAVEAAGWPKLRNVCADDPGLFPAYGLHPVYLESHRPEHLDALRNWIEREHPVAIGECGLDFHLEELDIPTQQRYFDGQLALAREYALPLIVHARQAVDAAIAAIKRSGRVRGVVHSFSGSVEQARQLWKMDFLGHAWRSSSSSSARGIRPRSSAPTASQTSWIVISRPRNEPARITNVLRTIAKLRDQDPAEIASATTSNAARLFGLPA